MQNIKVLGRIFWGDEIARAKAMEVEMNLAYSREGPNASVVELNEWGKQWGKMRVEKCQRPMFLLFCVLYLYPQFLHL